MRMMEIDIVSSSGSQELSAIFGKGPADIEDLIQKILVFHSSLGFLAHGNKMHKVHWEHQEDRMARYYCRKSGSRKA